MTFARPPMRTILSATEKKKPTPKSELDMNDKISSKSIDRLI
jgi:hypothetical protein